MRRRGELHSRAPLSLQERGREGRFKMSDDQNRPPVEKPEGREPLKIHAQESINVKDKDGPRLTLILEYIKKNWKFIILWALINLLCYLAGLYIHGWKGFILWLVMSLVSAWVGYKAFIKVRIEQRG
jgi:hypothetical protein